jgi:hypothetical protein
MALSRESYLLEDRNLRESVLVVANHIYNESRHILYNREGVATLIALEFLFSPFGLDAPYGPISTRSVGVCIDQILKYI